MTDVKLRYAITYLEMTASPATSVGDPPVADAELRLVQDISVPFYRQLYREVGEDWLWWERLVLSDEELDTLLRDPGVEVHVLYVGDRPAGFAELDRRNPGEVEVRYLGLIPHFIGRGLGGWMLETVVRIAWRGAPHRGGRPSRGRT